MPAEIYEFNEFRLDVSQKSLRKKGEIVAIQPKVFDMLVVFIEKNNELISHEELLNEVWGETFVEETSVRNCVHSLRKIFDGKYIETVPKRGYRFNAEVKQIAIDPVSPEDFATRQTLKTSKTKLFAAVVMIAFVGILTAFLFWKSNPKPAGKITIAVLPFTQVAEKTGNNLGVTDAVIAQLARLKDFQILPVGVVQKYAAQEFEPLAVGKELRSDTVLHGSFRQKNDNFTVSASLQSVVNGETLWTETFDVKPDKDIGLETSIAARLARLFSLKMVEYDDEKLAKTQNVNAEALNAYLSARKIWRSRDLGRVKEMTSLLQKAIELEPNWALAHSANAEAWVLHDYKFKNFEKAEKSANLAISIDEKQFGALTVLGQIAIERDFNFENAETFFKKAIEINPNYASAYIEYAKLLSGRRNFIESQEMLKKSLEIEPFTPLFHTDLCRNFYFDKKYNDALNQCKFALQLEPNFWLARKRLFWIYLQNQMKEEFVGLVLENLTDEAKSKLPYFKSLQAGNYDEYWQYQIANGKTRNKFSYSLALFYLKLNQKEKALDELEKAFENQELGFLEFRADPVFEPLWKEERFINLIQKTNAKP